MEKQTKIQIPTSIGHQLVDPHLIVSVCPEGRKSLVYLDNQVKILAHQGIEEMEKLLDHAFFFRCHRGCIINLNKISTVKNGYSSLLLVCGKEIIISKHRIIKLKQAIARITIQTWWVGGKILILS